MPDEATTILHARQWLGSGKLLAHRLGLYKRETTQEILIYITRRGWCRRDAHVGNAVIRAVGLCVFGDTAYGSALPLAILGILTVPILAVFAWRMFGDWRLSLIAASLLALSPAHVGYSRGLKSEADSTFFLLLALWCYWEGIVRYGKDEAPRWIWISGLLASMALACDGRLVNIPLLFFLMAIGEKVSLRRPILVAAANYARVLAAIAVMVVFWELPYHWAMLAAREAGISFKDIYTYWDGLVWKITAHTHPWENGTPWSGDGALAYFYFLFRYDGPSAALALLGFSVMILSGKGFSFLLTVLPVVVGFLVFWGCPSHWFYLYSFSMPLICLLGAIGFCFSSDLLRRTRSSLLRGIVLGLLCLAVAGWGLWGSWELVRIHSRLDEATQWLQKNHPNDWVLAVPLTPTVLEYDTDHVGGLLGNPMPARKQLYPRFRFLLIDPRDKFINAMAGLEPVETRLLPSAMAFAPSLAVIEASTRPVATFTNEFDKMWFFMYASHSNNRLSLTRQFLQCVNPEVDSVIRIYDLGEVLRNLEPLPSTNLTAAQPT